MDFNFGEEDQTVGDLARTILEDHATNERLREIERAGAPYDEHLWHALADADLLGIAIPESDGGSGRNFLTLCRLLQEVGRAVAPVPAFAALCLGALPIAEFGDDRTRPWLADIARGDRIVTAALEEFASSDPLAPTTLAEGDGAGVRLTGVKTNVPYAEQATHVLVPAVTDTGEVGLFYVASDGEGVSLAPQRSADGQPHAQLSLDRAPCR